MKTTLAVVALTTFALATFAPVTAKPPTPKPRPVRSRRRRTLQRAVHFHANRQGVVLGHRSRALTAGWADDNDQCLYGRAGQAEVSGLATDGINSRWGAAARSRTGRAVG